MNANDLARQIAALSVERRQLLLDLLRQQGIDVARLLILPQPRDTNVFPVSFAQERLWFLDQLTAGSAQYNIPSAVRLSGELDVPRLERCLNEIVRRHESLRTTFSTRNDRPVQVIAPALQLSLPVVDLTGWPENEREAEAHRLAAEDARRPFDLGQGPLLRATLLRLTEQDHIALFTMHHIIADGWSMGVLIKELAALYAAEMQGKPSPLPDLFIQYADYAVWQRNWLQGEVLQAQLTFWKEQLADVPPVLELPTDRPRPPAVTYNGATQSFTLDKGLSDALKALCRREGVTLYQLLLAAFQVLLYRYSGQEDICVGSPIANRTRAEIENLIGFFVNTLVLRTDLSGEPSFQEALRRVVKVTQGAYEHQDLPFEMLVEAVQPQRNMSHTPLFQVMFALNNAPVQPLHLPGLTMTELDIHSGTAKFDLTMFMVDDAGRLSGGLEYNTDLFDAETIVRMIGHWQVLLQGIVAHPDQPICMLPLLTDAEKRQILVDWNKTEAEFPCHLTVQQAFEMQVERTPDAPAVVYEGHSLSYRQLNCRANQVAHYLQRLGVGPETLVGICIERSLELVIGIIAVLKAGGAYLPLDPSYPVDRLLLMLEDSQTPVLLTQQHVAASLPLRTAHVLCLDSQWQRVAQESTDNPVSAATAESAAYIIYTSGSTGKPKGVVIDHRSALNLAAGLHRSIYTRHAAGPLRITLNAPVSFDASVQQLVMLIYGHTLYVLPESIRRDGHALLTYLARHKMDVVDCVPSQLKMLLEAGLLNNTDWAPRIVLPGGEAIDEGMWRTLAAATHTFFYNMYGPTECTVDSTTCCVNDYPSRPVIGRPMDNRTVYILDKHRQPVPIGVPGELYIGGVGVGRGYLHRPELNAERFIADPFSATPEARLYKTGDLVRYLADGNIEYLGRVDDQVKLRGYRIELGEIEAVLAQHPSVKQTVVTVREDVPGDKRLVAYVVPNTEQTGILPVTELRQHLKAALPDYMIPSAFVPMSSLPMTPNGKINRRALPAPEWGAQGTGEGYVGPRTPVEDVLCGIWAQVLGVERVGINDNFFDLGGHSLLATQIMSRVRDVFRVEVPLRVLFETPTVTGLAQAVEQARQRRDGLEVPPIQPVPRQGALPLSFAQQRLWFLDQLDPQSALYNIPTAVRLVGELDVAALQRSLSEVTRRHEILRTALTTVDGKPVPVISPELTIELSLVDLRQLPAAEREIEALRLARQDAQQPFDLSRAPLVRATLLRLDEREHILLFTMHHVVSDGWSMGVLISEIAALYEAFVQGQPSPLPELAIQYADFAAWQRSWLQGDVLATHVDYWKRKLADLPPLLNLPVDRPRPPVQTTHGAHLPFAISSALTRRLKVLGQQEGATLFMTLLAAYQTLLYRYSGQDDICVGTPIANRNRAEIENLIGFFVNTLAMRTSLAGEPTFRELLRRVRDTALEAYAHQDVPFEMLVDTIQPERNLSHSPLFQVMFVLQNAPMKQRQLPGLTLSTIDVESGLSMFDLTLTLEETDGGMAGVMEYNTDIFDATTIQHMIEHFTRLLEGIAAQPETSIDRLPLLSEWEQHQILFEWNDTAADYPDKLCIHQLVEQQAERAPDAVAVVAPARQVTDGGERHLTYRQLNERANRLAHYLRKRGVGPDTLVGICAERSIDMMVGLLGILKAGGAYVPLDPAYPKERLAYIMEDARLQVLVTQQRLVNDLPATAGEIIQLDADWPTIAGESGANPICTVTPDNLAYVIYTSGSTGKPKGVLVPHRGVVNHNTAMLKAFRLQAADCVLQFATINFDTAAEEIYPTWYSGATLVLRPAGELLTGSDLVRLIEEEHITVLDLPTAYWHEWVYELSLLNKPLPPSLRLVVVGGEKASAERYATWCRLAGDVAWLNGYGPTEGTIVATLYDPYLSMSTDRAEVPIGRPIANVQVYVLDRHMQPVPVGVVGELYIGGVGVARGYLNQPELTAEKFIPDPFSSEIPGVSPASAIPRRLYRTGDLARYRPDGHIEFLGRADGQVKVRGFRIELGEIESVLRQHPMVKEAVVLAHEVEGTSGMQRLVAYVVPAQSTALDIDDVRSYLSARLPEYMLPTLFVPLDALPLLPNGKVDRRRLPTPQEAEAATRTGFVAPRNETERILADIWAKVLGIERVGINDNFFALGGDSILSIQVIARAGQAGLHLTPRQLFQAPTVAGLAALAQPTHTGQAEQGIVEGPAPLTPIQRWFFEQDLPDPHHYNQALLLEVREPLDRSLLEAAVGHILAHHDALRLRFVRNDDGWQQMYAAPDGAVPLLWEDISGIPEDRQPGEIAARSAEVQASMDLERGPLLRLAYFDRGPGRTARLLLAAHHLVIDGVSWRILLEDLQQAYTQLRSGTAVRLPPKTTSYKVWAERLLADAQSQALQGELAYWLSIGQARSAPLPADFSNGDNSEAAACNIEVLLDTEETKALLHDVPQAYGTEINDALLTALVQAYGAWAGWPDVVIDLEGHGREDLFEGVDVSRTVGWFTAVYPVHLALSQASNPGEALKQIKEQLRTVPRRGIGFGQLRYLNGDGEVAARLKALPRADISFNYLGQFDQTLPAESLFAVAGEEIGPARSPRGQRSHLIDVNAAVVGGRMQIVWTYSKHIHRRETVQRLADDFAAALRTLIDHCRSPEAGGYTPSDFRLLKVDQKQLDKLLARYGKA